MYSYATFDPRPIPAAQKANDKVFINPVYGIEVTVPALAKRCAFNLDPQHSGGDANRAAIEDAFKAELPPAGTTLATVRADLDSIGAMAIFSLRSEGADLTPATDRIELIAMSDKFARGGWPGVRPLPNMEHLYDDSTASAETDTRLAPIAAAVSDFKVPLETRVESLKKWLLTGEEPVGYREKFIAERKALAKAIADGTIKAKEGISWCHICQTWFWSEEQPMVCSHCYQTGNTIPMVAVVESTHRAATSIGYCLAPVVVALNPEFRFGDGEPHRKFTICQFNTGYMDLKTVLAELSEMEPGWGGSPTIGGSPQGVNSTLTIDQVVEVVVRHLK